MKSRTRNYHQRSRQGAIIASVLSSTLAVFDFNFLLKATGAVLAVSIMMYGYLVNETVSVTAEYKQLESQIVDASSRLAEASAQMVIIEEYIANLDVSEYELVEQSEPNGFVSRSTNTGFTLNY